jgi:predicted acetyltransferase
VSKVRILAAEDFDAFVNIAVNAYPGWKIASEEQKERVKQRLLEAHQEEPTITGYGLFREGELQGGMLFHDFRMNCLGTRITAGGVGQIAVHLVHKKEHVAKEMMLYFLRHYRERGAPITMLYPFRPDFYKKMGFGYGIKMNQYRLQPTALPKGPSKAHIRYLDKDDKQALLDCYNRFLSKTHGMIEKSERELTRLVENPQHRIVGYEKDGRVLGYLVFTFEHGDNFILNDIHIREFIYESRAALSELTTFLHTQADQIRHVILNTQDEHFYFLLLDPRNNSSTLIPDVYHESNIQGVGLMYRVIDVPGMFGLLKERNFGGQTCKLELTVKDSFLPENAGSTLLRFEDGRLHLVNDGDYDVEVCMDVAEFSSLLVGAVNFRSLYKYGLVEISDPGYVSTVDKIFAVEDKPMCTTPF